MAVMVLACAAAAHAQAGSDSVQAPNGALPVPAEIVQAQAGAQDHGQKSEPSAQQTVAPSAKPGSVLGTVLDQSGAVSVGTKVRLTPEDKSAYREAISGPNGQFSFSNVPPGHFQLSVSSTGFENEIYSADLAAGKPCWRRPSCSPSQRS